VPASDTVEAAQSLLATLGAGRVGILHLAAQHLSFAQLTRVNESVCSEVESIELALASVGRSVQVARGRLARPPAERVDDDRTPVDATVLLDSTRGTGASRLQRALARPESGRRASTPARSEKPDWVERRASEAAPPQAASAQAEVEPLVLEAEPPLPVAAPSEAVEATQPELELDAVSEDEEGSAEAEELALEPVGEPVGEPESAAPPALPVVEAEPPAPPPLPVVEPVRAAPPPPPAPEPERVTPPRAAEPARPAPAARLAPPPQAPAAVTAAPRSAAAAPRLASLITDGDEPEESVAPPRAVSPAAVRAGGPPAGDDSLAAGGDDDEQDVDGGAGVATSTGGLRLGRPSAPANPSRRTAHAETDAPRLTDEPEETPSATQPQVASIQPAGDDSRVAKLMDDAVLAAGRGDIVKAIQAFTDVLDLRHDRSDAHIGRGRCYLELGDYSSAMSDFQRAEDLHPNRPDPHVAMGDLYFARKEYRRAIEFYDQAVELDGSHAMARCRRGISHYYRKNFRQAFQDLQRAYSLDPEIPNIRKYVQMAVKKLERGD
jgi:Flp pilus assembly protein TadD